VLKRRPDRVPVLDGHRPAQPGPRARHRHLPDQRALEAGHYFNPHAQRITEARQNGAKVIVLDTRLSNTASHADYWLSPQPAARPPSTWPSPAI